MTCVIRAFHTRFASSSCRCLCALSIVHVFAALLVRLCQACILTCGNAALHMVNTPTVSISMTVLKPLGERSSAIARKLQRHNNKASRECGEAHGNIKHGRSMACMIYMTHQPE